MGSLSRSLPRGLRPLVLHLVHIHFPHTRVDTPSPAIGRGPCLWAGPHKPSLSSYPTGPRVRPPAEPFLRGTLPASRWDGAVGQGQLGPARPPGAGGQNRAVGCSKCLIFSHGEGVVYKLGEAQRGGIILCRDGKFQRRPLCQKGFRRPLRVCELHTTPWPAAASRGAPGRGCHGDVSLSHRNSGPAGCKATERPPL